MARTLNSLGLFILLMPLCCTGCASWRSRKFDPDPAPPRAQDKGDGGLLRGILEDVSNASMNHWDFNKATGPYPNTKDSDDY
jgi:hypothetical protein